MLHNLLVSIALLAAILIASAALRAIAERVFKERESDRARFWSAQAIHMAALGGIIAVVVVVWLPDSSSAGAAVGWLAAGVAVALQRVITAFAGYLILLRGKVFTVGDRITIGGVRGDVVALGFMQTTVMEMGQSPGERSDDPSMWVGGRQYSGRIVRVTNDKIFDEPVYNYTREFPFMWDELMIPVKYGDDYPTVERIMVDAARTHTAGIIEEARASLKKMEGRFFIDESPDTEPRVYLRMTDNWIELSLRYIARSRGNRVLSDRINRDMLAGMQQARIGVASATYDIVGLPAIHLAKPGETRQ